MVGINALRRLLSLSLSLILLLTLVPSPVAGAGNERPPDARKRLKPSATVSSKRFVEGEILVKFKPGISSAEGRSEITREGADEIEELPKLRVKKVRLKRGERVEDVVARFERNPKVEYAQPSYIYKALDVPNDTYYQNGYQWGPSRLNAEPAWTQSKGTGVKVAVVDTGVDYNHPDLAGKVIQGYDFVNHDSNPMDDEGHGTHVAGIIGAATNNSLGVAGMGWNAQILAVKVLDEIGQGTPDDIADGIRYAADNGAKIINLSLGGPGTDSTLNDAVVYARGKGAAVFAATGNDGINIEFSPSNAPGAAGVGATNNTTTRIEQNNPGYVATVGSWSTDSNSQHSGGSALVSSSPSASLTFTLPGGARFIVLRGLVGPAGGTAKIYIDGSTTAWHVADFYWNQTFYKEKIIVLPATTSVKIVPEGDGNVYVDALDVDTGSQTRATFSNYGPFVDVATPGENILSTIANVHPFGPEAYAWGDGTSMATPMASGVAALVAAKYPTKTGDEIARMVMETATDLGTTGRDDLYGHGAPNAASAVTTTINSVEEGDARLAYSGTWTTATGTNAKGASGGAHKSSTVTGSTATFTFSGTSVYWVTRKGPNQGVATVTFDGAAQDIDLYASGTDNWQYLAFKKTVADGPHTLEIKVKSTNGREVSVDALDYVGLVDSTPPTAPADLALARTNNVFNLSWSPSTDNVGVAGYKIERSPDGTAGWTQVGTSATTNYDHTVAPADQNKTWHYRVRAYDIGGLNSGYSNTISGFMPDLSAPTVPSNVSVARSGSDDLQVTWSASADNVGVGGYQVERSLDGSSGWTQVATETATSFTDTDTVPQTWYYYRLRAFDAAMNISGYSSVVSGVVDTTPPTAPTGLQASVDGAQVSLAWAASEDTSGIDHYAVERSPNGTSGWVQRGTPTATSFAEALAPADQGKTWYYRVRSYDKATPPNPSDYSPAVPAAVPDVTAPSAPIGFGISRTVNAFTVDWIDSSDNLGVTGYRIERSFNGSTGWIEIGTSVASEYVDVVSAQDQNKTLYYKMRAYDAAGNVSGYSTPISSFMPDVTAPSIPANVQAFQMIGAIGLQWNASTDNVGVTGYKIWRSTSAAGPYVHVDSTTQTSYVDGTVLPMVPYFYKVSAYDSNLNDSPQQSSGAESSAIASSINDANADYLSDALGFYDYGGAKTGVWMFKSTFTNANPTGITFAPVSWWVSAAGEYNLASAKTVTGDFNADGRADVIALYSGGGSNSTLKFFESTGNSFKAPATVFSSAGWNWGSTKLVAGDFDGDGKDELFAFYNYGGTHTGVYVFDQNAQGQFSYRMVFDSPYWDWSKTRLLSAKDGAKSKVIAAYNYGGTTTGLWTFELNDQGNLPYPTRIFISQYWDYSRTSFLTGDVEGDGLTDIIAFYNYGGTHTGVFEFESTGTSYNYPVFIYESTQWNYNQSTFIPGDFDGDGLDDAGAIYDYGGGTTGIWLFLSDGLKLMAPHRVYLTPYWNNAATKWVAPYEIVR
ncbi:MAG: S8 family serine peptidase [Candidatus Aquicultorales bacterium]